MRGRALRALMLAQVCVATAVEAVEESKFALSRALWAERSSTDTIQQTANASGMEKIVGGSYGKTGTALPSSLTQIEGPRVVRATALTRPAAPPMIAPRVVKPRQYMASNNTGKFVLAATPKASPTM